MSAYMFVRVHLRTFLVDRPSHLCVCRVAPLRRVNIIKSIPKALKKITFTVLWQLGGGPKKASLLCVGEA